MPLLRKQPFHKVKPSPGLRPDDEVFHCTMTNEIFKTYEEFFERTILCNSLVWSCGITGKSGLTYAEALESEKAAEKRLAAFDLALQKPLLFLVTLTRKSRFLELCDDIFLFSNDRYFIGENVDVIIGRQTLPAVILRVVAPARAVQSKTNGEVIVIDEDSEPEDDEQRQLPGAAEMMYVVSLTSNPHGLNKRVMVKAMQVSRKKGAYNRDRNKLFLKHKCQSVGGLWCVKDAVRQKMFPSGAKFEDFFSGPRPQFTASEKLRKSPGGPAGGPRGSGVGSSPMGTPSSSSGSVSGTSSSSPGVPWYMNHLPAGSSGVVYNPQDRAGNGNRPIMPATSSKSNSSGPHHRNNHQQYRLQQQQRLQQLQQQRLQQQQKEREAAAAEAQRATMRQQDRLEKLAKQLALKKKFEEERQRIRDEKERQRVEKEKERLKKMEEKRLKMEKLREWSRPRDDLECDDLKPLPDFKELKTRIPMHLFGDALMVLELMNAFRTVFDFDQFFPKGLSWDHMESAVMGCDQEGPLCDLLQMLLCALFTMQEAEAGEVQAQAAEEMLEECDRKAAAAAGDDENGEEHEQISNNDLIRSAILSAQFSQQTFGVPLRETTLDQYTLTEILRLHLMSSGADANPNNARFRYQQRGGYSSLDDPGLELRKQESALMKKLVTGNVFDLGPEEKVRLLTTLVQQVTTYAAVRDMLEDTYDKLRVKKYDLKILQWNEARRVRENIGAVYRRDMEERVKEHDYHLQEMARAAKIKQAKDNGLEPPDYAPLEDPRLTPEQKQKRTEEEEAEERRKKEEYAQKDLETQREIMDLQQTNAIYPLGRDRTYRRYWYFSSLPAVLVEDNELFVPFLAEDVAKSALIQTHNQAGKAKQEHGGSSEVNLESGEGSQVKQESGEGSQVKQESGEGSSSKVKQESGEGSSSKVKQEGGEGSSSKVKQEGGEGSSSKVKQESGEGSQVKEESDKDSMVANFRGSSSSSCGVGGESLVNGEKADVKEESPNEKTDSCESKQNEQDMTGSADATKTEPRKERAKKDEPCEEEEEKTNDSSCGDAKPALEPRPEQANGNSEKEQAGKDANKQMQDTSRVERVEDPSHNGPRWYVIDSKPCLLQLMGSLNPRGFRESALHNTLLDFQRLMDNTVESCPLDKLCASSSDDEKKAPGKSGGGGGGGQSGSPASRKEKALGSTRGDSASEAMELVLRDGLLDMEGRIHAGCLGAIRVKDRNAWRAALENGGYSPLTDEVPFTHVHSSKKSKVDSKTSSGAYIPEEVVARDLAHAMVQIARGVDPRYFKPPFEHHQRRPLYERWEESALGCGSLSRVFLHLSVLDKSVKWNRSTLKMRCRVCRRMRDDDKMLLCDKCDRGHHIYCLKPPLTKIPSGDWFCHTCRPNTSKPAPRKRRKNFEEEEEEEPMEFENSVEEASDNEEEEENEAGGEEENVDDDEDDEDIPNEDICCKCQEDGELILCDVCPRSFHLHCAQPPLKKVPKGKWMCHVCLDEGRRKGKGKQEWAKKAAGTPNCTSGSGKRSDKSFKLSGSRQHTPRNSPTPTSSGRRKQAGSSQEVTPKGHSSQKGKNTPKSAAQNGSASKQNATPKSWGHGKGHLKRKSSSASNLHDADEGDSDSSSAQEEMQAAEALLHDLMDHKEAWPFLEPVDRKVAPDYYKVIETPMDLSTIQLKLHKRRYASADQLLRDISLIFANCVQYNLSSAPVYQSGQALSKFFTARARALGLPLQPSSEKSPAGAASKKQRR